MTINPPPSSTNHDIKFWKALSLADRVGLRKLASVLTYPDEALIIQEEDDARIVLVIMRGCVKVVSRDVTGYQAVLALRDAGDVVGEMASIEGLPRSATVQAVGEVQAMVVRSSDFRSYMRSHPDASNVVQRCMSARLREADRHRATATRPVSRRLAAILADLAERYGRHDDDGGSVVIDLPLSQDDLAGLLSVSRRTVSRVMETWRRRDIVVTGRRSIVIKRLDLL